MEVDCSWHANEYAGHSSAEMHTIVCFIHHGKVHGCCYKHVVMVFGQRTREVKGFP